MTLSIRVEVLSDSPVVGAVSVVGPGRLWFVLSAWEPERSVLDRGLMGGRGLERLGPKGAEIQGARDKQREDQPQAGRCFQA